METLLIVKNMDEFGILFDFNELKKRKLAKGGYGVVCIGTNKLDGDEYAINSKLLYYH